MNKRLYILLMSLMLAIMLVAVSFGRVNAQAGTNPGVITLAELGRTEIFLNGPFDTYQFSFGLPAEWKLIGGATLNLNLLSTFNTVTQSGLPVAYGGTLTVKFNRDTVAVLPLNEVGTFDYSIDIPSVDLISPRTDGEMELRFELNSGISCTANQHMNVVINPESQISLPYEEVPPSVDLIDFPRPIFQRTIFPDSALVVIPDRPTSMEVQSAMTVMAGMGNLTSNDLTIGLTKVGLLTAEQQQANHIIFVGKAASLPLLADLSLPLPLQGSNFLLTESEDDGVLQMINSPWSQRNAVLVVSGNTDEGTLKAAQAVSTGLIHANTAPNLAIIDTVQQTPKPNPLIAERSLGDLGYGQIVLNSRGIDSTNITFYIPPGGTVSNDAYFELAYGHSSLLDYGVSGIVVLLNGQPIGSVRFTDETAGVAVNKTRITIPPTVILPGNNQLEIRSNLEPIDICTDPNLRSLWASIWPESRLHLPFTQVQSGNVTAVSLDMFPDPFVFDSTLGNLAFIVQKDDMPSLQAMARVASYLGDRSNGSISMPKVFFDDEISAANLDQYNVIVIGRPSQMSIMDKLNSVLPVPFEQGTDLANNNLSQVIYRVPADAPLGYVELLPSPWNADNVVVAALGNTDQGVSLAASALVESPLRGQLAGNFAVVNGVRVETADTRLGAPVLDSTVTTQEQPTIVEPILPTESPVPVSQPQWILPAILVAVALIILIVIVVLFINRRKTHNAR